MCVRSLTWIDNEDEYVLADNIGSIKASDRD